MCAKVATSWENRSYAISKDVYQTEQGILCLQSIVILIYFFLINGVVSVAELAGLNL